MTPSATAASFPVPACALHDVQPPEDGLRAAPLPFFTVAVGASAGGVEALSRLFGCMPPDSGCAFVVVLHLAAERESLLVQLLGRVTPMPVVQAEQGMALAPNRVHVIPPGQYLTLQQGRLQLEPIRVRPLRPVTVDRFMISLAGQQHERAVGVVLTGVDSDGALGIKAIKAEGGLTLAQSPATAAHPGMPQSALATGLVDRELPIEQMPQVLQAYVASAAQHPVADAPQAAALQQQLLPGALEAVRVHTGLDFRGYKAPMLLRRIQRRMGLTRQPGPQAYLQQLRDDAQEAQALADDCLIGVTEFFREPEAWEALAQQVLPALLARKQPGEPVRVWVPACASGEEAYSLAMLLLEQPEMAHKRLRLQVFGTDIDRAALDVARKGLYASAIEHTVAPARLQRFFRRTEQGWQVCKLLRDAVMFAPQNVVSDPPFSHMDLVSCRNLLIYMEPELQRRVLQMLHFALDPAGVLALGKSETAHVLAGLFLPLAPGLRLFGRVGAPRMAPLRLPPPDTLGAADAPAHPLALPLPARLPEYGRMVREALLEHRGAAAVLLDRESRVLYVHGPVQDFLALPEGAPSVDLFAMLRDGLRPALRAVLHRAWHERGRVECLATVRRDLAEQPVRLVAWPLVVRNAEEAMLLSFESPAQAPADAPAPGHDDMLHALEEELRQVRQALRTTVEELESANEELKVANEEAMSMNEELQSSNEELQTSKEELQSVNEELSAVNAQLQDKVQELETANNDLGNLLSSTHTPTLFLDRRFHIKRFTPAATRLFNLLSGDIGRPLADIAGRTDVAALLDDARQVLLRLAPVECEVRSSDGAHFLRRILPYRTQEDRIDGIVVTFTDITEIRRAAEGLRRYAAVMQGSSDAIVLHDLQGRVLAWNAAAQAMYDHPAEEAVGADVATLLLPEQERAAHAQLVQRLASGERLAPGLEARRHRRDGSLLDVSSTASLVRDDGGAPVAVALIERDITPRKRAERALRESEQRFRVLADGAPVLIWVSDARGVLDFANRELCAFTGLALAQLAGRSWLELLHPDERACTAAALRQADAQGAQARLEATVRLQARSGALRWMKLTVLRQGAARGMPGFIGSMVDIDDQVRAEQALREADRRKDEFLAMLGHELRNPLAPIRNAAEVLRHVPGADPRLTWVRETLVRQVEHVTRLVDDLLDISLITRGALRLHCEPLELGEVVQRAIESTAGLMQRRRHHFHHGAAAQPLWVEGDAIRLAQLFENLLANAAKYTDEGGDVAITLGCEGNQAVVRVRDNGLGMSPAMLARAFELFVQDERAVDRSQGGLGIGLALVRRLVDLHGGQIEAFSEGLQQGSEFVVRLPLLPEPPSTTAHPQAAAAGSAHGRVLLVDDDVDAAESLAMLLKLYGYDVALSHSLEGALKAAREQPPQVALLDIAMPDADGYEVARRLRALPGAAALPCVALSGYGLSEHVRRSEQAGFARHLVKPVDPAELDRVVRALLAATAAPSNADAPAP